MGGAYVEQGGYEFQDKDTALRFREKAMVLCYEHGFDRAESEVWQRSIWSAVAVSVRLDFPSYLKSLLLDAVRS